jgi:hypothetical protein
MEGVRGVAGYLSMKVGLGIRESGGSVGFDDRIGRSGP